jgi:hypothetical protein
MEWYGTIDPEHTGGIDVPIPWQHSIEITAGFRIPLKYFEGETDEGRKICTFSFTFHPFVVVGLHLCSLFLVIVHMF